MYEQLYRISEKIEKLKKLDSELELFGAEEHKYLLNEKIDLEIINSFEQKYNINLPKEYVAFLTQIGNGGAGPYYGLERFENGLFGDLDYKNPNSLLDPSKPFPHTDYWNIDFYENENHTDEEKEKAYLEFDEKYFDQKFMYGAISICNFGCGISLNLVVNGEEYGKIWTDDRCNSNGIYPSLDLGNEQKITFLDWYELWLDNSLNEIVD